MMNKGLSRETFVIIPSKGQENDLEFKEYAGLIAGDLQRHGYFPVTNGAIAYYGVRFVYGISNRKTVHKMVAYTLPSSATYSSSIICSARIRMLIGVCLRL